MTTPAYTVLAQIQYLPSSAGALYDNASSTTTYIRGIWVHNANTTTETIQIYWVQNSGGSLGTAGATNLFIKETLTADQSKLFEFPAIGIVLTEQHDSIQGTTTTASKVTCILFGDKAT